MSGTMLRTGDTKVNWLNIVLVLEVYLVLEKRSIIMKTNVCSLAGARIEICGRDRAQMLLLPFTSFSLGSFCTALF